MSMAFMSKDIISSVDNRDGSNDAIAVSTKLPRDLYKKLDAKAVQEQRSKAWLIKQAIAEFLAK